MGYDESAAEAMRDAEERQKQEPDRPVSLPEDATYNSETGSWTDPEGIAYYDGWPGNPK